MSSVNTGCIAVALLLAFLSSTLAGQNPDDAAKRTADEENLHDLVLRQQMENWYRSGYKIFFVSIEGKDPSSEFLKRLQDIPRNIKKKSDAKLLRGARLHMSSVVDRATHERGIMFSTYKIQWLDDDSVKLDSGYDCGSLCGGIWRHELHRENGGWVIKKKEVVFMT